MQLCHDQEYPKLMRRVLMMPEARWRLKVEEAASLAYGDEKTIGRLLLRVYDTKKVETLYTSHLLEINLRSCQKACLIPHI